MSKDKHPHLRMIEEMLLKGYDVSYKKISLNVINKIGNDVRYQVFNEKTNSGTVHSKITEAVTEFLLLKKRLYKD